MTPTKEKVGFKQLSTFLKAVIVYATFNMFVGIITFLFYFFVTLLGL